jgi:hypothetical protein
MAAMHYDTSVAHIARVYDYWLGGKDNFAADREAGTGLSPCFPLSSKPPARTGSSLRAP